MPDPFDADRARQTLDEVPVPDLWSEALRRADDGSVAALSPDGDPGHRNRWLAVAAAAAVAVLAVGTASVLLRDDGDQDVDAGPAATAPPVNLYQDGPGDCAFGVTGEPLESGPLTLSPFSELTDGTNIEGPLGASQRYRIDVPGIVVTDLVGERVEDVELRRGTAQIWFGVDFVQVRWFTGGQDPCGSFTVTVAGGTEDANRHAAVDLADRVLLPSELDEAAESAVGALEGAWQLDSTSAGGESTEGHGEAFTFAAGQAGWTDGCNQLGGGYEGVGASSVRMTDVVSTRIACPWDPTSQAVQLVMGAERITVTKHGGLLHLGANDAVLVLRPATGDGSAPVEATGAG